MNNCTNCNKQVDRENAILCAVCNVKYSDILPSTWSNQKSFEMKFRYPMRMFAVVINFLFLGVGLLWLMGEEIPFFGSIPESIGFVFLIGGLIGMVACMVCYN